MEAKRVADTSRTDRIKELSRVIEHYTTVTNDFKQAYCQLEQQVAKLNIELEKKNSELESSLAETRELQHYLHNILSSMNSGVICTDSDEVVTVFNRAAEELTGYGAEQVIGRKYGEFFLGEDANGYRPLEVLRHNNSVVQREKYIQRKDGESIPVRFSMAPLQSEGGKPIGVVEVFEDMSEFRRMEREIHQGRTLMALGEMAGHVAHQIRNPLGAIAGFATLLERDLGGDDPRQRHARKIIEAVGNMERIIGNLVFLARPVQPSLRKVNIRWLLNDVLEHIAFQTSEEGKEIQFIRKIPKSRVEMMADPHLFQQLFLHLLRNAVQAIDQKGFIKLQLQKLKTNELRIVLVDSGKGIPFEIQNRLFHPFASDNQKRIGLGLPIVRKIVDLHQGRIKVSSKRDAGTRITLTFPSGL